METEDCSLDQSIGTNLNQNNKPKCCNASICLAYILSLVASGVIVHGFYLAFITRSKVWFILPALGLSLILVGSCFYRMGTLALHRANCGRISRRRRKSKRATTTDNTLFESHLSLNMLPQCFSNFDNYTSSSRILNSNGHRYLILPIDSVNQHVSGDFQIQNMIDAISDEQNCSLAKSDQNNIYQNNNKLLPTSNIQPESIQETSTNSGQTNATHSQDNSILIDLNAASSQDNCSRTSLTHNCGSEERPTQTVEPSLTLRQTISSTTLSTDQSELVVQPREISQSANLVAQPIHAISGLVPLAASDNISDGEAIYTMVRADSTFSLSQCNEEPPSYNEVFDDIPTVVQTDPNSTIYQTL